MNFRSTSHGRVKTDASTVIFKIIAVVFVSFFALLCVYPFVLMVTGSFTSERVIITEGYRLIPSKWSLESYAIVLETPRLIGGGVRGVFLGYPKL